MFMGGGLPCLCMQHTDINKQADGGGDTHREKQREMGEIFSDLLPLGVLLLKVNSRMF